uniref:Sulfatase N-terminal domain-containing protein n=1 Tax=Strongyloides stercoralis TaxID=6248 RepID=A0A0K0EB62_STRER
MFYRWAILIALTIYFWVTIFWILNSNNKYIPSLVDINCSWNNNTTEKIKFEEQEYIHFPQRMSNTSIIKIWNDKKRKMREKQLFKIVKNKSFKNNILKNVNNNKDKTIISNNYRKELLLENSYKVIKNDTIIYNIKSDESNTIILSKLPYKMMDKTFENDKETFEDFKYSHSYENTCRWPTLSVNSFDLKDYVKHRRQYRCTHDNKYEKLVTQSSDGLIFIAKPKNSLIFGKIECYLQKLTGAFRPNVRKWEFEGDKIKLPIESHIRIDMDQFVITCIEINDNNKKIIFEEPYTSLSNIEKMKKESIPSTETSPSITILAIDSVSRNQFFRHMYKSLDFMLQNNFHILNGYTKIGDNSAVNMMATFSGLTYDTKARWMDDIVSKNISLGRIGLSDKLEKYKKRFIWQKMEDKKCITQYNDEISNSGYGIFSYNPFQGFSKPPANYYFRAYYEYLYQNTFGEECLHGNHLLKPFLDIWERFSVTFPNNCHFSFNFITKFTHDDSNAVELFDDPLFVALQRFKVKGVFNNTVIIIMGDHGQRVANIQKTYYGRVEERMPLLAIYLPETFRNKFKKAEENIRYNKNRLTSNFDIYETLLDIVNITRLNGMNEQEFSKERGLSLFRNKISPNRTCFEAKIPENFCVCQQNITNNVIKNDFQSLNNVTLVKKIKNTLTTYLSEKLLLNKSCIQSIKYNISTPLTYLTISPIVRFGARYPKKWKEYLVNNKEENIVREIQEISFDIILLLTNKMLLKTHLILQVTMEYQQNYSYIRVSSNPMLKSFCNGHQSSSKIISINEICKVCFKKNK